MSEYSYSTAIPSHTDRYIMPAVREALKLTSPPRRLFELGCGSGATAGQLAALGFEVTAVDVSQSGVALARAAYPACRFEVASAYDPLSVSFGTFDVVVSLEVIEHLYAPRAFAATLRDLLNPGGIAIISTPYHGYLKNLALAATGRLDAHFTALWDHGHIKFWSRRSLCALFAEVGLEETWFMRVGRISILAKSMICVFRRA
jgi:2-polyprenyl-3-methyl-5-hydroxy-6-metoxy-1,4-benzoquinol methylase